MRKKLPTDYYGWPESRKTVQNYVMIWGSKFRGFRSIVKVSKASMAADMSDNVK
jgi:hypothetical protein